MQCACGQMKQSDEQPVEPSEMKVEPSDLLEQIERQFAQVPQNPGNESAPEQVCSISDDTVNLALDILQCQNNAQVEGAISKVLGYDTNFNIDVLQVKGALCEAETYWDIVSVDPCVSPVLRKYLAAQRKASLSLFGTMVMVDHNNRRLRKQMRLHDSRPSYHPYDMLPTATAVATPLAGVSTPQYINDKQYHFNAQRIVGEYYVQPYVDSNEAFSLRQLLDQYGKDCARLNDATVAELVPSFTRFVFSKIYADRSETYTVCKTRSRHGYNKVPDSVTEGIVEMLLTGFGIMKRIIDYTPSEHDFRCSLRKRVMVYARQFLSNHRNVLGSEAGI